MPGLVAGIQAIVVGMPERQLVGEGQSGQRARKCVKVAKRLQLRGRDTIDDRRVLLVRLGAPLLDCRAERGRDHFADKNVAVVDARRRCCSCRQVWDPHVVVQDAALVVEAPESNLALPSAFLCPCHLWALPTHLGQCRRGFGLDDPAGRVVIRAGAQKDKRRGHLGTAGM